MESLPQSNPQSGGERKVDEYVSRIAAGENKDSIIDGLPESFKSNIEAKLATKEMDMPESTYEVSLIPPQYEGLDAEALDFIWTIPEYLDPQKTIWEREKKTHAIAQLREKEATQRVHNERLVELRDSLGVPAPKDIEEVAQQENLATPAEPLLSLEERKKLQGWTASYELAKVAKNQDIDLSTLSREAYAQFAIDNALAIDDTQLREHPSKRGATSVQEVLSLTKEQQGLIAEETDKAFAKFSYEMKQKALTNNRYLDKNIRVRQGTRNSNSWLFFGVNDSLDDGGTETYKSYISFKDLNTFSPEQFINFMATLRDAGYNGDIKVFQDLLGQGPRLNDQIVMHGRTQADAELALKTAEAFFGDTLDQKSFGKDEVIDGKNRSYSEILARKIADAVHSPLKN